MWSLRPFLSENAHLLPIITGATILCFSFLGFDAVTTLCEETPDAAKVIPRAIFLTALYGGVILSACRSLFSCFSRPFNASTSPMPRCRRSRCT